MWQAIHNGFYCHTLLNKLADRRNLYTVDLAPNESVLSYCSCVKQLAPVLKGMWVTIDGTEIEMGVLNGRSKRFENLFVAPNALSNDYEILTLESVYSFHSQQE